MVQSELYFGLYRTFLAESQKGRLRQMQYIEAGKKRHFGTAVRTAQVQPDLYQKNLNDFAESGLIECNWYSFLVKNYKYTVYVLIRICPLCLYYLYRMLKMELK